MSKTESKKYYWLKLKEDFFDDETIQFIEEQPNGIAYSNFYLKLCLKSLRTDGRLMRLIGETFIPYDLKSIARLTGVNFDTVKSAMELLLKIGTVKILDSGEIYLAQVEEMVGNETDKAVLMRKKRAEDKLKNSPVTMLPECYPEIEIEKEIENKSKSKNSSPAEKTDYAFFQETYNAKCTNLPNCRALTEKRKKAIKAWLKDFEQEQWSEICEMANKSGFLIGSNDRGWKADIDFLLRTDKTTKILEGGYSDGGNSNNSSKAQTAEKEYGDVF